MKHFVVITLTLIVIVMVLRNPDRIIKMLKAANKLFAKIWTGLVTV